MGVIGAVLLMSLKGYPPAPSPTPPKAEQPKTVTSAKAKSHTHMQIASVKKPSHLAQKPGAGLHAILKQFEETLSPPDTEPAVSAPAETVAEAPPIPKTVAVRVKTTVVPHKASPVARHAPTATDPMARLKRSIQAVGDKIKRIDRSHPKSSGDAASDRNGDKSLTMPDDESMVASAPPMVRMPDMPKAPPAPAHPGDLAGQVDRGWQHDQRDERQPPGEGDHGCRGRDHGGQVGGDRREVERRDGRPSARRCPRTTPIHASSARPAAKTS